MYICQVEDTVGRDESQLELVQRITVAGMTIKQTAKLAEREELAIGMRAMVLLNIATEADLANGTRGEVVDIKLDPREPTEFDTDPETGGILLRYPPVLVLFKPDDSSYPSFEGLPKGILPIVPSKLGFSIKIGGRKWSINRRQLAMTPAYAFTDYKSQGQTLQHVYIDLQSPPTGKLTPFSAYVALSRSKGRDRIRLLRGFENELFTTHPSLELEAEDARLDALTEQTKVLYP
jgi:ATP-dependent exoDNAse (exonuclease V) alpha subunit